MDDLELGLSSGTSFFLDEFYESFQAPKFYDFINPRDSGNADAWFLDGLPTRNIKELVQSTVQSILQIGPNNPSRKQSLIKEKEKFPLDQKPSKYEHCCENKDPNQVKQVAIGSFASSEAPKTETFNSKRDLAPQNKTVRKIQKPGETSPVPNIYRYLAGVPPATVPQKKKILATRKAAQQHQQQPPPFSKAKALFEQIRDAAHDGIDRSSPRLAQEAAVLASPNLEVDSSPHRKQDGGDAKLIEQAAALEAAMELLRIGDENAKVCSEALGADRKPDEVAVDAIRTGSGNLQQSKPVFSFKAVRKEENSQQQNGRRFKRKSVEAATRRKTIKKTVAPAAIASSLKRPSVTCPQPFRLRTEERGALKEIQFNKRMEQYIAISEGSIAPKAMPLKRKLPRPVPSRSKDSRTPVEVSLEMIAKDLAASSKPPSEADEARQPRKQIRMPVFDRPFRPRRSTKKLTIPIEPKFHAPRTCAKHCHAN